MTRIAVIDKTRCKPNLCGFLCMRSCPVNMTGSDCIYEDSNDKKAGIDEILCTGCGICPKICPFDAIKIINLPEMKDKPVIHQFGPNGFRIFDLPLIQEGSIIGIMGRNGIGKSTVINVLSKMANANFGRFGTDKVDDLDYFQVLKSKFKGSALQNYFTKLEKGEIHISYKPQQIVNIPNIFSGRVFELLMRVNSDEKKIKEVLLRLNILGIYDRDIKVLSGGELQRLALASAFLRENSNFYVLDEITNYLDIYERLSSSRFIKENTSGKTALVVEHDLVVLDYLVDYIHIMYGEPGAYGMMTGIKSAKEGINAYLEGFAKEENVRFRDRVISFDKDSVSETKKVEVAARWENMEISQGEFSLSILAGEIKKGEIVGIIGRNALGKTTFVKTMAEKGFDLASISYKPQLIPRDKVQVISILSSYLNFTDAFYQVYVLDPLNLKPILEKNIDELSGGELQRFAIARCLLEDANVYLIDEPTAFLDIEDRLKIAKMLKNFFQMKDKSAFIIDHDLVFMDYLSDKLLVFSGLPSIKGSSIGPLSMREGMNTFLKDLEITFRRDDGNKRPRVNKEGSVKDQEQRKSGEYYYS